jgi:GNAT superfamily N-acetyltransferase
VSIEVKVSRLLAHPEALPLVTEWFRTEWPGWYGAGGTGDAEKDLQSFSNEGSLPVGIIAFANGAPCGAAALKGGSIPSHAHLSPWAAAGFVLPALRGQGIGAKLLAELEVQARALGYASIYCGTATAKSLLLRAGWRVIDSVELHGKEVSIYERAL